MELDINFIMYASIEEAILVFRISNMLVVCALGRNIFLQRQLACLRLCSPIDTVVKPYAFPAARKVKFPPNMLSPPFLLASIDAEESK